MRRYGLLVENRSHRFIALHVYLTSDTTGRTTKCFETTLKAETFLCAPLSNCILKAFLM